MIVPDGFHVTLFASEPDCQQPIAFCIDDRGRLWVAEAYNYPQHGTRPGDRIVIFADTDGDGRFNRRTVFYDRLNYVTGIEVGFGGVWVMSPPYFYFLPDHNGDDQIDGEPRILLDGFGNHANSHNLANALAWGPDGWLYGTHGRTNWSLVGVPGSPERERIRFDGGVYRYHPVRHVFEPFADGTTNPWGIDWNDLGDAFVCNCVNPHVFHVIQGAHYEPWRNRESSRFAYQRIPTIADHLHFVGRSSVRDGLFSADEDEAGGGHAHCGTMVYLGDNWPDQYRNTLFTNNIHGHRINNDLLRRSGSGYTASHGRDLMRSRDPWFMGVTLGYGPDGAVFVSDWSDTGECHSVVNTRRGTGRIYKISYGEIRSRPVDLGSLPDEELVELQLHRNDWYVRHARRLLQERAAQRPDVSAAATRLREMFAEQTDVSRKLRALWALHGMNQLDADFLTQQLSHESEYVRAWAVRLLCEDIKPPAMALARFRELAGGDSPYVRLQLACALQRLPPEHRWSIAQSLMGHAEDVQDPNLPLMIWYGIEPLVDVDLERFVELAKSTRIPLLARHIGRRTASSRDAQRGLEWIVRTLLVIDDGMKSELLGGTIDGLGGHRSAAMPPSWRAVYANLRNHKIDAIREQSLRVALIFDDPTALAALRQVAADATAKPIARNRAIESLVAKHADDLTPLLLTLVDDPETRRSALRGLAEYDDPDTPRVLLCDYSSYDPATRQDAIQTLAARPAWATELLNAVSAGQVPRSDLTAYTARQLHSLGDVVVSERLKTLWGELRSTSAEKTQLIADLKRRLTAESLAQADRSGGRVIFDQTCASCHRLFGAGGNIGPDITGSQRTNLDYLLQTLVDPSSAVPRDYQMHVITTSTGRVITGLLSSETESAVTIQTINEKIVVPESEVEARTISPLSIMPEGMLRNLSIRQVRELFAYIMGPDQVPLPGR
jgi:putative membrane-bound dehydrogenase-like protein